MCRIENLFALQVWIEDWQVHEYFSLLFGLSDSIQAATIIFILEQGEIKTGVSSSAMHWSFE